MTRSLVACAFGVCVATLALAQPAHAATFTMDQAAFLASNPGLTTIDFNGLCDAGICAPPLFSGVTFTAPGLVIADGPSVGAPTDFLADNTLAGFLDIAFNPSASAVGFNIAANFTAPEVLGDMSVSLFAGATLLDTRTFHTNGFDTFDTFVGWSGVAGLDHLHISVANAGDFVSIDNLSYGRAAAPVPEPTTIALVGLGLATITRRRWKGRRARSSRGDRLQA
jgi:hypothetical protein